MLGRTLFGYSKADVDHFESLDPDKSLTELLTVAPEPAPPLNGYDNIAKDPHCNLGETWVDKPFDAMINQQRLQSFRDWWFGQMLNQGRSIREKMALFWHNHFATQASTIFYAQLVYEHHRMLRSNVLGNFKDLVKKVTLDPGMLIYLNGYLNQKDAPDENYARELQELFTLGKGPDSLYTESDVREAARVLTGWQVDPATGQSFFNPLRHDTGNKSFSGFYGNQVIQGSSDGEAELDALLDMIFSLEEVSKFICRSLYRFFVYYVVDDEVEEKIIAPLATTFRANNYDIMPVMRQLLQSEHFFEDHVRGAVIKNPADFTVAIHKNFGTTFPDPGDVEATYNAWQINNIFMLLMQMELGEPPNVAGWEAYWSAPAYHELWINSVTLPKRNQITDLLLFNGLTYRGTEVKIDILAYTENIPQAEDPDILIQTLVGFMYPKGLSQKNIDALKAILLSGQSQDFYWTQAWLDYVNDKQNETKRQIVFFRLYSFYKQLLNLAEYQLS